MGSARTPGHDPGHAPVAPPVGLTWEAYVEHFVAELGGWTALADELLRRAAGTEAPDDLQSAEKGLRRLAKREHRPGGQYGRWMLRFFGVPTGVEDWARWLGQYHSRFADLPSSLRLEQLRLWDRPPVSESRLAAWINVGLASVHHRLADLPSCRSRLHLALAGAGRAGPAAIIEAKLFAARLATDEGDRAAAERLFDEAEAALAEPAVRSDDRLCYRARLVGQRAFHLTKPVAGAPEELERARALFEGIEEAPGLPFVSFRRCAGLAYCVWKLGDAEEGARLARCAAEHAGDGGFVRFRIMALNLLTRMVPVEEARAVNARAERLARMLEDEDLVRRVLHRAV